MSDENTNHPSKQSNSDIIPRSDFSFDNSPNRPPNPFPHHNRPFPWEISSMDPPHQTPHPRPPGSAVFNLQYTSNTTSPFGSAILKSLDVLEHGEDHLEEEINSYFK